MHELFAQHVRSIEIVIVAVCRNMHLPNDQAEDFAQDVRLHLLQRPTVLQAFRGQSNVQTYLFRVIRNFLVNWYSKRHGRWRPSRRAQRLGKTAIALEKLIDRDGLGPEDAIEQLAKRGVASRPALSELADAVRRRTHFQALHQKTDAEDCPTRFTTFETAHDAERVQSWIKEALAQLSPVERELLHARFCDLHRDNAVAIRHDMSLRQYYARVERILRRLRREAVRAGVDGNLIGSLIDCRALSEFHVMDSDVQSRRRPPELDDPPV